MKYLAYGANMDGLIMRSRCRGAELLCTGVLEGYRLLFKGEAPSAYATIEQWDGYQVPYVLWEITTADEAELDRFEGYPRHYKKNVVEVEYGGEKFLALYYHKPEDEPVGQPMTHYVEVLEGAYQRFNFDIDILNEALRLSNDYFQRDF